MCSSAATAPPPQPPIPPPLWACISISRPPWAGRGRGEAGEAPFRSGSVGVRHRSGRQEATSVRRDADQLRPIRRFYYFKLRLLRARKRATASGLQLFPVKPVCCLGFPALTSAAHTSAANWKPYVAQNTHNFDQSINDQLVVASNDWWLISHVMLNADWLNLCVAKLPMRAWKALEL